MQPRTPTHPAPDVLAAFGLGKLNDSDALTVANHLEACPVCRQAVEKAGPDSFIGRVRAAKPSGSGTQLPAGLPAGSLTRSGSLPSTPLPTTKTSPPPELPPELLQHPKFQILSELGHGGMGTVYHAKHKVMDRDVALKVINKALLEHPDALPRFFAEVKAAARLDHPNIVRAYDAEPAGGLQLFVMEYVEGKSLAQVLDIKGTLPVAHACHYVRQAALGLQHAFEHGMVHRDIKPANLMLTPKGKVKVLDFGLARLASEQSKGTGLTQANAFMGTPEYVAPEQAMDARQADIRADLYSLGCTLYCLLTGQPPFQADTVIKMVMAHLEKEAPSVQELRPEVSPELAAVVSRLLAKDPKQRYQKPAELVQALSPFCKIGPQAGPAQAPPLPASAGRSAKAGTMIANEAGSLLALRGILTPSKAAPKEALASPPFVPDETPPFDDEDVADGGSRKTKRRLAKRSRKKTPVRRWPLWQVMAGVLTCLVLGLVGLWSAGVFKIKTPDGMIVLEDVPADAEVFVDGDKVAIKLAGDGKPIEIQVAPGKHKLQVKKADFIAFTREIELASGKSPPIKVRLEPVAAALPKTAFDQWFAVGTRWEGRTATTKPNVSPEWSWWITIRSRDGNKFKGRLVGEGRADVNIEGTLGDDGTSFRWKEAGYTPNPWSPIHPFESLTVEGKCKPERCHVDWKSISPDGQHIEGVSDFTIRRAGPRKNDEDVWPPPLYPRRTVPAPAGKWSVQDGELVEEEFVEDAKNCPVILFGDLAWKDYDFHLKAMKTAGDDGFRIIFDGVRPGRKITQWCLGSAQNRETLVEIVESLPTGMKCTPLTERKPMVLTNNQWYDIHIKTRGQWIECFLDGDSVFKIAHPDRSWGGKVGLTCLRIAGRFKDIEVKDPDGKVFWEGPPELP